MSEENKELFINTLSFAVVFTPFITALVYITALFMDSIYKGVWLYGSSTIRSTKYKN